MGRPSNRGARREQIVDGLLTVMARKGFEGATITEIAKAAGLAPGLVHYHFRDKQEILLELVARLSAVLENRLRGRLLASKSPREALDAYVDAHLATGADADPKAVASWVALGAEAVRQGKVKQAFVKALNRDHLRLQRLVQEALESTDDMDPRISEVAAPLFAAIQGFFLLSAVAPGSITEGSAATDVKRMLGGMLAEAGDRAAAH
jgi:TetR/AcrR family transcriptional regulator, transcriptional repressor of bet genes